MLENPFKPITPEEDTDPAANANIVGTFLGSEAQAAYEKLNQGQAGKLGDDQSDLKLTDAEKAVVKEAREKEVWDRAHYIRWAESFGEGEDWVDETFTFHSDGSVECADLDLRYVTKLHEFPQDLKIGDYLNLRSLTSAQGLTLPTKIVGYLSFGGLTTAEGLTFPEKIGDFLNLESLPTAEGLIIPKDFHVRDRVYINPTLRPFFEKLKKEGKIGGDIIVI